jgi:hypothetical protein
MFGPETRGVKEDALSCVKMALAMQKRIGDSGRQVLSDISAQGSARQSLAEKERHHGAVDL